MRLLLALAPPAFRARYAADLLRVHGERAPSRRGWARALFGAREVWGMLVLVLRLRLGGEPAAPTAITTGRGGGETMGSIARNVRHAVRMLRRHPGYAATSIVVLALGIGATTAIFSAVNAYFFRPLPFRDAERLVALYETNPEFAWTHADAAPANALDWRERVEGFEDVAVYSGFSDEATYILDGEPTLFTVSYVSGNFFDVLGVPAALGRTLRWDETWDGRDDVVVLSHDLWRTAFGGDPDIVGRRLEFDAASAEVVGVMPAGFLFPGDEVDLWTPWGWGDEFRASVAFRRAHFVRPIARLAPGVSIEDARAQHQAVVAALQQEYPATNRVMGAGLLPLREFLVREVRGPLVLLQGSVLLLLLLSCVNVANLALVRASDRSREVALRRALGAGRARVTAQLMTESVVLALAGGALGLAVGWAGVRALEGLTPLGIDGATGLALDHRVVLVALAASLASGVLFGLAPVLRVGRLETNDALKDGERGGTAAGGMRTVRGLVAAEVALALLLVVGAGLMVRTSWSLRQVDPGFRTEGALAVQLTAPSSRYPDRAAVLAFWDELLVRLEGRPGIETAGTVGNLPLNGQSWSSQFQAEGWPPDRVGFEILHRRADRGYFEALDIPLIRGRMLDPTDGPDAPFVVLINETFAREHFPGEDPIGQRIAYDRAASESSTWYEIIGIVGDQHQTSPGEPARAEAFESRSQDWARTVWVVMRTTRDPMSTVATVRSVVEELDPLVPLESVRSLREVWRTSMAREELVLTLLGVFAAVALLLASVGVYGVTAQAAGRRRREMGIRIALGADRASIVGLMLRQGMAAVLLGLVLGLGGSLLAARSLTAFLYQVEPTDPATLGAVALLLGGIGLIACWVPALQATRVDPVVALKPDG
jgi:putative ABC transport system permease protein